MKDEVLITYKIGF